MPDKKIGGFQAVILLFLSRAFNTLNYIPSFEHAAYGVSWILGGLAGAGVELLALVPALMLDHYYKGQNVVTVGYRRAKPLGVFFAVLYSLAILTQLSGSLVGFAYFLSNVVYPQASVAVIVLTMAAACFWAASRGLEGLARAGAVVFVFFLLSTLTVLGASLPSANIWNLHPLLDSPAASIGRAMASSVSKTAELYLFLLLFPKMKGNKVKCAFGLVGGTMLLNLATGALIVAVLGDFGKTQTFPYYTLSSIADLSILQRLDSLHMTVWVFVAFLRITLLINVAGYCLQIALPKRGRRFAMPALFLLGAGGAIVLGHASSLLEKANTATSAVVLALTAGLPLVLLALRRPNGPGRRRKRKEGSGETQMEDRVSPAGGCE